MSHQNLDSEIAHLEHVFGLISTDDHIPLSYWRGRLRKLTLVSLMPIHRARVARLEATLRSLEEAHEAQRVAPPLRSTGAQR